MTEPVEDLYLRLGEPAPADGEPGQTRRTAKKETVDDDREELSLTLLEIG